jgi:hypothetical protein
VEGKATKKQVAVTSYELLLYRELIDPDATTDNLPEYFVTSDSVTPKQHIDMQAAAQEWIDSAISKCVAKGTPVITNHGILPIEKLGYATVPGFAAPLDNLMVLDKNSEWKRVTSHYMDNTTTTIKISLENGSVVECSPSHKLYGMNGWIAARDITVGTGLLKRDVCSHSEDGIYSLKVTAIEYGQSELYDIEVEDTHSYLIDGLISHNTINIATDYPFEKFKDIYQYGYEKGLKGCTTFRFNPEAFQGVLVNEKDLDDTTYVFTLDDGTEIACTGNEKIEYGGETHTAANLFDAVKEGYYGKF